MARNGSWSGYAWAVAATAVCTALGFAIAPRFDLVNIAMVYLLAVVMVALRHGRGPTVATAILSVATFDYAFVPPQGAFTIDDLQYLFTFAIMLGVGIVISELAESVRRQEKARASLVLQSETERVRSALLASISHDLRTPLAVMSGASSSLAESGERLDPAERRALAQSVFEQSRELSERVGKVLQMTRLETGSIALERDWASLAEIADSALRHLGPRLAAHRLVMELPGDLPLVRVDSGLIEQALANLLDNAARHTPAGTVVRLRAWREAGEVIVSVEDLADRLEPAEFERVFAKFEHGTVGGGKGIGLGLAITRAIVRLHGGRTWAERVPAGGTAFRFSLPLEATPSVPQEPGVDSGA